jgi:class 3 adenylate cyclase/tetratricopeptide (TPR) repeat protein
VQCSRCQHENPSGQKFCGECGARLAASCPACGASNSPGQKFCGECGASLTDTAGPRKFGSPETYTPKHLAEKILTSRSAIEGERKQVTVLFADLKGSMEVLADRDPEEARKLLDPVLERMMEAVHRYEGTVNQVMGDGIMALFGAPLAHEDHAVRACYAALAMQGAIRRYTEEVRRAHGIEVQIRVGLHSGEVVVRAIGSDLHMDYSAIGQTTHLAARMEQLAPPGSIRLTGEALRLAEGFVQVAALGPIPVKGLADPVEVFELLGAAPTRTRLQAAAARGLTRFVGRQPELEALRQALAKAHAGHGQVVALVGEAGVGKSRLVWEVTHSHGTQGWLLLESGSVSYGQATAYLPVIDLLKAYCQIESRDDPRKLREKVTGKLLTLDRALEPTLPAFLSLLDVPVEDPQWQALDPPQRRQRTLDACKRLLLRESQVQPLLLVFEDLHWIDSETQALLDSLLESLPTARLLLLVNYRPEYQHAWGSKTYYTQLRIDPLPPESADALLQALLGTDAGLEPLKHLLIERTEGNPFFLEESVRTLIETQVLAGERGAYRLAAALPSIQVPATVQAVLAARIDRLPADEKRLLQAASVIGKDVPFALLHAIAGVPEDTLRRELSHLQGAEFLYETSLFPDLEYTFKHALTHEVAYNSLLAQRRKELHRIVGLAIEALYADRLVEHFEVLAHHFSKAAERDKTLEYLVKAGDKTSAAFANREAVSLYEQALALLGEDDGVQKADLLQKLATIYLNLLDPDASRRFAERALALYEKLGDRRGMVGTHLHLNNLYTWQWDGAREDLGLKHLEAAAAITEEDPDSVGKGRVYQRIGHGHLHRCQPVNALAWAQRAEDIFGRLNIPMGTSVGTALTYTGRVNEGIGYNEKNWELVMKAANPLIMAVFGHDLSLTLALVKDVSRAREWGERVLPHVIKASPNFEAMLQRPLALIYTLAGDIAKAEDACRSVEQIESKTLLGCIYEDAAAVGFCYLRRGAWDKAGEYLATASRRHEDRSTITAISGCALALASLRLQTGEYAQAESLLRRSLDLCRSGGNVLFELWVLPVLGELYLTMGDLGKAAEQVTRGFELLSPDQKWYGLPAGIYLTSGMLAAASKRWDEAETSFAKAVAINRRYQLPWDEGKTLYEWGLMHVARGGAGDRDTAWTNLDAALDLFRRVEARRDIDKVLAAKAQLGG